MLEGCTCRLVDHLLPRSGVVERRVVQKPANRGHLIQNARGVAKWRAGYTPPMLCSNLGGQLSCVTGAAAHLLHLIQHYPPPVKLQEGRDGSLAAWRRLDFPVMGTWDAVSMLPRGGALSDI